MGDISKNIDLARKWILGRTISDEKIIEEIMKYPPIYAHACRVDVESLISFCSKLRKCGYTSTTFRAVAGDINLIYAYMYWSDGVPLFLCFGPTYVSNDGEFMDMVARADGFLKQQKYYDAAVTLLEPIVLKMLQSGDLSFHAYNHPTSKKITEQIDSSRWEIRLFLLCCIHSQLTPTQDHIMLDYRKLIGLIFAQLTEEQFAEMRVIIYEQSPLTRIINWGRGIITMRVGHKISTLSIFDVEHIMNVESIRWREVYVYQLTTDILINNLSPGFPIFAGWTLIEGAGEQMFHLDATAQKYRNSAGAEKELMQIGQLKDSIRNDQTKRKLCDIMSFLQTYDIVSNYSLVMLIQHVGPATSMMPTEIKRWIKDEFVAVQLVIENILFVIFPALWALRTIHKKFTITHGDLHWNNSTFRVNRIYTHKKRSDLKFMHMYIDDEQTFYVPITPFTTHLIDFSRACLGTGALNRLATEFNPSQIQSVKQQNVHMMSAILSHRCRSYCAQNKIKPDDILAACQINYDQAFVVISAYDIYMFTHSFRKTFKNATDLISEKSWNTIQEMTQWCNTQLIELFDLLMRFPDKIDTKCLPIEKFMAEFYSECYAIRDDLQILGEFNIDRPMKYSLFSTDKLPPTLIKKEMEKHFDQFYVDMRCDETWVHGMDAIEFNESNRHAMCNIAHDDPSQVTDPNFQI